MTYMIIVKKIALTYTPVSYTHLDVYKRQRIFFINTKFGNSLSCVYFEASMVNII